MDKQILHSILETTLLGTQANISFNDPFNNLNGDYIITVSKSGRGRGSSRIIELQSANNPSITLASLNINGKERMLGTSVSDYISGVIIGNNTYGSEEAIKMPKDKKDKKDKKINLEKPAVIAARKLANILGNILKDKPNVAFKIIAQRNLPEATGEWYVSKFSFEDQNLTMDLVGYEKKELRFSFNSETHGHLIRDVSIIDVI